MNIAITFDVERDWYRVLGTSYDNYKQKGFKMLEYAMPKLLEISEEYSVPYTLFICGEVAQNVPHLFEGLEKNHSIGVHTHPFSHEDIFKGSGPNDHDEDLLRLYSYEEQKEMISRDKNAIMDYIGVDSNVFRAGKHGADQTTFEVLEKLKFRVDATVNNGYQLVGWKPYLHPNSTLIEVPTYCDASPEIIGMVSRLIYWSNKFDFFSNAYSIIFHPMVFGNPLADREEFLSRYSNWIESCVNSEYNFETIPDLAKNHSEKPENNMGEFFKLGIKPIRSLIIKRGDSFAER